MTVTIPIWILMRIQSNQLMSRSVLYLLLLFSIAACNSPKQINTTPNFATQFNSSSRGIDVDFKLYHHSSDSSKIFFALQSDELLYTREHAGDEFEASFVIGYKLYNAEGKVLLDSASKHFNDSKTKDGHIIQGALTFRCIESADQSIVIYLKDLNRNTKSEIYSECDKANPFTIQNFLIKDTEGVIIASNILSRGSKYSIESRRINNGQLLLKRYATDEVLPPPAFSSGKNKYPAKEVLDSVKLDFKGLITIDFTDDGLYTLSSTKDQNKKFSLLKFSNGFPKVSSTEMFYRPIRYISSSEEYNSIISSDNIKKAAEDFWVKAAGSSEQARLTIKGFYTRVEDANKYFSTYREGWATDRGLILIIFGPPDRVFKRLKSETWQYGMDPTGMGLSFNFSRINHPLSGNVYELQRSPAYKSHWYRALDSWRNGHVYYAR